MNEQLMALYFSVAVVGVWWLFFVEYRSYLLAKARQDLFASRDALFAAAERGALPFNSAAYIMTRDLLNGGIRFTHRLTLIRVIGILVAHAMVRGPKARSRFSKEYATARQELSEDGRKAVDAAHVRMHVVLIRYLVTRSLFLSLLNVLTMLLVSARAAIRKRILRTNKWAVIDMEIKEVGEGRVCDEDIVHA